MCAVVFCRPSFHRSFCKISNICDIEFLMSISNNPTKFSERLPFLEIEFQEISMEEFGIPKVYKALETEHAIIFKLNWIPKAWSMFH